MTFYRDERVRNAKPERTCPECRTPIPVGDLYVKFAGQWDGNFYNGFSCEPCDALKVAFVDEMMRMAPETNGEHSHGQIIEEAVTWLDNYVALDLVNLHGLSKPAVRDAIMPIFYERHDRWYRDWRIKRFERRVLTMTACMSRCSAIDYREHRFAEFDDDEAEAA